MTIPASGRTARSASVAVPFITGMDKTMRTTSGRIRTAVATT
jgi:hypothetical protein